LAYRSGKSERLIKGGEISALLSFVSFSKLVILVYTGQPVENNTAYAHYINNSKTFQGLGPEV
jgi:hypothetical protein